MNGSLVQGITTTVPIRANIPAQNFVLQNYEVPMPLPMQSYKELSIHANAGYWAQCQYAISIIKGKSVFVEVYTIVGTQIEKDTVAQVKIYYDGLVAQNIEPEPEEPSFDANKKTFRFNTSNNITTFNYNFEKGAIYRLSNIHRVDNENTVGYGIKPQIKLGGLNDYGFTAMGPITDTISPDWVAETDIYFRLSSNYTTINCGNLDDISNIVLDPSDSIDIEFTIEKLDIQEVTDEEWNKLIYNGDDSSYSNKLYIQNKLSQYKFYGIYNDFNSKYFAISQVYKTPYMSNDYIYHRYIINNIRMISTSDEGILYIRKPDLDGNWSWSSNGASN